MLLTRHLFNFCGALAALSLLGIAVLILSQIGLRLMGSQIPSADDFAAWGLSASIFLALPATLIRGDHIRVTSLRQLMPERLGHIADILAAAFAAVMMSRKCGDRSRDISDEQRQQVIEKLTSIRAPESWVEMVAEVKQLDQAEAKKIYGDGLPAGLTLI